MPDHKPVDERAATDAALRAERENADRALAAERAAVNAGVDLVVHRARDDADARVNAARERAAHTIEEAGSPTDLGPAVAELHALEDDALARERATIDEVLRMERAHARTLSTLLPLERDRTDRHLHLERDRSDAAVEHRDDFLGMVSHDLRNLLSGVLYSAELLARQVAPDAAPAHGNIDRIRRYSARMNRLIGDLLDVTSIDAGKLAVAATLGDPAPVIREAVELFRGPANAAQIALTARVADDVVHARFDHDRLLQVLANLLSNAVKFTPPGGSVVVDVARADALVHLAVHDTGAGIPGPLLTRIFDRFWQVGPDARRGMGLGLYIARCIVEAHGGTIWAESEPGAGTTVRFTLPAT